MKRTGVVLTVIIGLLLAAGCQSGENTQRLGPTHTPTPEGPTPTPTPEPGAVIGRGNLDITTTWYDTQPTVTQTVKEAGFIPFEILNNPDGADKVQGQGVVTLNYTIDYLTAGTICVYQAVSTEATVSGSFFRQPACDLALKLTIDYPEPHLISGGSALCGTMPDWSPLRLEIPQIDAVNGEAYMSLNGATGTETAITLTNLVLGEATGCFAGVVVE